MNRVCIHWIDAVGPTVPWESLDEVGPLEPPTVETLGYVVDDTDLYITVAQTVLEDGQVAGRMTIPKGCVTRIEKLTKPTRRKAK
jgi:hypothetical protein